MLKISLTLAMIIIVGHLGAQIITRGVAKDIKGPDANHEYSISANVGTIVSLDNENIHVNGAFYVYRTPEKLFYKRFSDDIFSLPSNRRMFSTAGAESTTGIRIEFKTKSSYINLTFSSQPNSSNILNTLNEKGFFKILKDGKELKVVEFPSSQENVVIQLSGNKSKKESVYEVILPSYSTFALTKLELDHNSGLVSYTSKKKKIYLAFGDSLTHGRGQDGASFLTFPYLIAEKLNLDFYNLGVGGAQISIPVAKMAKELPQADLITILIGYNDLNRGNKSKAYFEKTYSAYLQEIRVSQPKAKIVCINLLFTKKKVNPKTKNTPEDFREIIRKVVTLKQMSDKKLFLIEGSEITSLANLQEGEKTDPAHLTVAGNKLFADQLYKKIKKYL